MVDSKVYHTTMGITFSQRSLTIDHCEDMIVTKRERLL
jgi:hypothetical protein